MRQDPKSFLSRGGPKTIMITQRGPKARKNKTLKTLMTATPSLFCLSLGASRVLSSRQPPPDVLVKNWTCIPREAYRLCELMLPFERRRLIMGRACPTPLVSPDGHFILVMIEIGEW